MLLPLQKLRQRDLSPVLQFSLASPDKLQFKLTAQDKHKSSYSCAEAVSNACKMVSMKTTIGNRIAQARTAAGLNQSELAARIGVTPQSVQHWEHDRTAPRGKRVEALSKILNVTPEWITFGSPSDGDSQAAEVIYTYEPSFDIVQIPFFDIELAAGMGSYSDMEEVSEHVSISKEILNQHGLSQEQVAAVRVTGDSMMPRLLSGDTILVDTSDKIPRDRQVYAIAVEDDLKVKRLIRKMDGNWIISSDNPD